MTSSRGQRSLKLPTEPLRFEPPGRDFGHRQRSERIDRGDARELVREKADVGRRLVRLLHLILGNGARHVRIELEQPLDRQRGDAGRAPSEADLLVPQLGDGLEIEKVHGIVPALGTGCPEERVGDQRRRPPTRIDALRAARWSRRERDDEQGQEPTKSHEGNHSCSPLIRQRPIQPGA